MADHSGFDKFDDLTFERLFASLDDVRASDDLKASTLDAIFAHADEPSVMDSEKAKERGFVLIEGIGRTDDARHDAAREDETTDPADIAATTKTRMNGKKSSFILRVAAALIVLALVGGGTAACALPATHVYATAGETTFDLGVNMFGITVSAEADSDTGKEILEDVDVRYESFEEAFDQILEAYEQRGGEDAPTVSVESSVPFGGVERLDEEAHNVMDAHERFSDGEASQSKDDEGTSDHDGAEGRRDDGETSDGGVPQDEPTKPEAPQGDAEQRTPEATGNPAEQTRPADGSADETGAGQFGQDMPDQGVGQPSGEAAETDDGSAPPR